MKNIFTMTTFQHLRPITEAGEKHYRPSRTVGFMYNKEEAIQLIKDNVCDLNEANFYPYALVEEVPEGIYAMSKDLAFKDRVTWFKWNDEKSMYEVIPECPEDLKRTVNFSMG